MESHIQNKTFKIIVLTLLFVAITLFSGFFLSQNTEHNVSLKLNNNVTAIVTEANTVEELLLNEDILLEKGGYINVSPEEELDDNMRIVINNPKTYTVSIANDEFQIRSIHTNVEKVLSDNGITIEGKDYTYPTLEEKISEGSKIEIYSVKEIIETEEEFVPYERIVRKNKNLDLGTEKIVQEGKDGLKEIYISKEYLNGEFLGESIVEEKLVSEPISNIVEKGTKAMMVTSRGNTSFNRAITMSATAYDLSFESCGKHPDHPAYGITASGTQARPGAVAVDPKVIPLGTRLYIESLDGTPDYGFATAEDTGGAIKGNKIDLFFHSSTDVKNFGRRNVKVYILD